MGSISPTLIERFGNRKLLELFHCQPGRQIAWRRRVAGPTDNAFRQINLREYLAIGEDHHAFKSVT